MEGKDIESTSRIEEAAIEEKRKKVSMTEMTNLFRHIMTVSL